jgi:hypothetical protein
MDKIDILENFATYNDDGELNGFDVAGLVSLITEVVGEVVEADVSAASELVSSLADKIGNKDFDTYNKLVSGLVSARADKRKSNKDAIKAQKEERDAINGERGKLYYDSLEIGAEFEIETANGVVKVKKIETKSKTGSTAACELLNPPAGSKTAKRYPKFCKVVVPADFGVEKTEETAEEVVA